MDNHILEKNVPWQINMKMSGSKAPDVYAHIGAGQKVFHPLMSKLMWA